MSSDHSIRYAIRLPDGSCLGRFTISGGIVPVPPAFAHTFENLADANAHLEHARTALGFPDAKLAPLSECLKPNP